MRLTQKLRRYSILTFSLIYLAVVLTVDTTYLSAEESFIRAVNDSQKKEMGFSNQPTADRIIDNAKGQLDQMSFQNGEMDLNGLDITSFSKNSLNTVQNEAYADEEEKYTDPLGEIFEEYKTDRFIVKYKDGIQRDAFINKVKDNVKKVRSSKNKEFDIVYTKTRMKNDEILSAIKMKNADLYIDYIQPDYEVTLSSNDPYFDSQWGIYNKDTITATVQEAVYEGVYEDKEIEYRVDANVVPAWEYTQGEGVTVAVLDTGIDITHEDLSENIWRNENEIPGNGIDDDGNGYIDDVNGWNFCDDNSLVHQEELVYDEWHGTHIAGIIAAAKDNGKGIAGVAPKAKIMPLKVFKNGTAYTSDIVEAIDYAEKMGVRVANCSWGTTNENPALKEAIENSNMLFVCAAGNSGMNIDIHPVYPASYTSPNVITVASINKNGQLSSFSNYGENTVDVAAPGEEIYSTVSGSVYSYGFKSGTSMAAAFVSGETALILSNQEDISMDDLKQRTIDTSDKLSTLIGNVSKGSKINSDNAITGQSSIGVIQIGKSLTVSQDVYESPNMADYELFAASNYTNRLVSGDFNGDGKKDIAGFYDISSGETAIHVWLSTGASFQYEGNNGWWRSTGYTTSQVTGRVVSGDFNADGKDDLAAFYDYWGSEVRIHVWLSTGNSFQYQWANGWWSSTGYTASAFTNRLISGDFNNDNKDDIAVFYDYGNSETRIHIFLSTGSSFQYQGNTGWWASNPGGYTASQITGRVVSGDFNADGNDDIAAFYDYGNGATRIHVWLSTGTSFQYQFAEGWWRCDSGYTVSQITGRVVSGDYNGDGKDDIAAMYDYWSGAARIHVWLSTGTSFQYQFAEGWWRCDSGYTVSQVTGRVVSGDYNGDGKDDIATMYDYWSGEIRIHVWLSTGSAFQYQWSDGWWTSNFLEYMYDNNNRLIQILKNCKPILYFDYDANGNLINKHQ